MVHTSPMYVIVSVVIEMMAVFFAMYFVGRYFTKKNELN